MEKGNNKVSNYVEGIYAYVINNFDRKVPGLLSGITGDLIFLIEYCKYKGEQLPLEVEVEIQSLIENSVGMSKFSFYSFCNGKSGVNWFYSYLYGEGLITTDELSLLTSDKTLLSELAIIDAQKGNCDFLHGALGHFYSLIQQPIMSNVKLSDSELTSIDCFLKEIKSFISKHGNSEFIFPSYDYNKETILVNEVNFGLAHGVISILRYCLLCYKSEISKENAAEISFLLIEFLLKKNKVYSTGSHYPYSISLKNNLKKDSRLGWCYGDLPIAYTLYEAGRIFSKPDWYSISLDIFQSCLNRKHDMNVGVVDASICHGSAGIAHFYNKMWSSTNDKKYKEEADFWMERTLTYAIKADDNSINFKSFSPLSNSYEKTDGILMGASGVGLALISHLTNDFSWDGSIMLS